MRRIDPEELTALDERGRRELLLDSRPAAADSRFHWWSEFLDRARQDAVRTVREAPDRAAGPVEMAAWAIGLAEQAGDLSPVDAAVLATALSERLAEAGYGADGSDAAARRCLAAMPWDPDGIGTAMEVERRYLLDGDRAWTSGPVGDEEATLDRLDHVRRLVQCLSLLGRRIRDPELAGEVRRWTALAGSLEQGEDVQRRDREVADRRRDGSAGTISG